MVNWNTGLRQLGMEQLTEVRKVRTQEPFLVPAEEEVGHHLEVGHQLVSPMQ